MSLMVTFNSRSLFSKASSFFSCESRICLTITSMYDCNDSTESCFSFAFPQNTCDSKIRVRENLQLNESKSLNFRDTSSAVPCKMTAQPIGTYFSNKVCMYVKSMEGSLYERSMIVKDLWEIKSGKFMMQT